VDISFTVFVCLCVCLFVRLRISPPRIKPAASNFSRRFIGVQGRESHIFVNFAPPEAPNQTNRPSRGQRPPGCKYYRRKCADVNIKLEMRRLWNVARRVGVGSACVDIGQSPLTYLFRYCGTMWVYRTWSAVQLASSHYVAQCPSHDGQWPSSVSGRFGHSFVHSMTFDKLKQHCKVCSNYKSLREKSL